MLEDAFYTQFNGIQAIFLCLDALFEQMKHGFYFCNETCMLHRGDEKLLWLPLLALPILLVIVACGPFE